MPAGPLRFPHAVCFDMDGTLTRPMIDFDAIRHEIGITGPILEAIRHFDPPRRAAAERVLDRHELAAARESELHDDCESLLEAMRSAGVGLALITRNSCRAMQIVLEKHGLRFDHCVSREDKPEKPHPECVWRACRALGAAPRDVWMVGDSHHDVEAGRAAGVATIWLRHDPAETLEPPPDVTIDRFGQLRTLFEQSALAERAGHVSKGMR